MRDRAADLAFASGWRTVRLLPEPVAYRVFAVLADAATRRGGQSVERLTANLRRVVPDMPDGELQALVKTGMRSYFRYWCEVFRLPEWDRRRIVESVDAEGVELLHAALAAGRGMVVALPHMGNWDHVGAWATATGVPVSTVAERLKPESLFDRFVAVRRKLGIEVFPVDSPDVMSVLAERVRANRAVCLLADRNLRSGGVPVELFGEPASLPPGPAMLSLLTKAPLLVASTSYPTVPAGQVPRLRVTIRGPLEPPASGTTREKVAALTQAVAGQFEQHIAAAPQDWHMLQRVWAQPTEPSR